MKKVFLLTMVMALFASVSTFASSKYKIDEASIDQVFETSINVAVVDSEVDIMDLTSVKASNAEPNVWIALVLDWLLGGLAVHRIYLGGKVALLFGYLFTCGGIFGLLPLGDFIVLLINNGDISKYVDNDAFIMW